MLDDLNKLKEDTEMNKIFTGFPLCKVRILKIEI